MLHYKKLTLSGITFDKKKKKKLYWMNRVILKFNFLKKLTFNRLRDTLYEEHNVMEII